MPRYESAFVSEWYLWVSYFLWPVWYIGLIFPFGFQTYLLPSMSGEAARETIGKKLGRQPRLELLLRGQTNRHPPEQNKTRHLSLQHQTYNNKPTNLGSRVPYTTYFLSTSHPGVPYRAYSSATSVSSIHKTLRKLRESNMSGLMSNLDIIKEADA